MTTTYDEIAQRSLERLKSAFEKARQLEPDIHYVEISYAGGGDSGSVEMINAFSLEDEIIELPINQAMEVFDGLDLMNEFDDAGWDLAYDTHPGFEINEGGQGTVTVRLDLQGRIAVSVHHEENIISTSNTVHVFT
jgi:hypothetical protein